MFRSLWEGEGLSTYCLCTVFSFFSFEMCIIDDVNNWICTNCIQSLFPFNNIRDDNVFINAVHYYSNLSMDSSTLEFLNKCIYNPFMYDRKRALLNNRDIDPDTNFFNTEMACNNCTYYLADEFNRIVDTCDKFSVMHVNSNSLLGNFDNFCELNASVNYIFDVIAVSETHLESSTEDLVNLEGYIFLSKHRTYKKKGGVGLYLKNNLNYKIRHDIVSDYEIFELLSVEIINPLNRNIIVTVVYRPPGTDMNAFNPLMGSLCDKLRSENKIVYWAGDFNIDLLNAETHKTTNDFLNIMYSNSFYPAITKPTRITEHSATVIDNIYSNNMMYAHSGLLYKEVSDHLPVFLIIDITIKKLKSSLAAPTRNLCDVNLAKFNNMLSCFDWSPIINSNDADTAYHEFLTHYKRMFDECCPLQHRSKKHFIKKNWMTPASLKSRRTKERLFKIYQETPSTENKKIYCSYKNKFTTLKRKAEKEYYCNELELARNNLKETWRIIKNIMNKNENPVALPGTYIKLRVIRILMEGHSVILV